MHKIHVVFNDKESIFSYCSISNCKASLNCWILHMLFYNLLWKLHKTSFHPPLICIQISLLMNLKEASLVISCVFVFFLFFGLFVSWGTRIFGCFKLRLTRCSLKMPLIRKTYRQPRWGYHGWNRMVTILYLWQFFFFQVFTSEVPAWQLYIKKSWWR